MTAALQATALGKGLSKNKAVILGSVGEDGVVPLAVEFIRL